MCKENLIKTMRAAVSPVDKKNSASASLLMRVFFQLLVHSHHVNRSMTGKLYSYPSRLFTKTS